jgi:hypothetical protein
MSISNQTHSCALPMFTTYNIECLLFPPPHPSIKVICLFVCFDLLHWDLRNHNNPLPCSCTSWFVMSHLWWKSYCMFINFVIQNSIKWSFILLGQLWCIDGHVGRLLVSRVLWRWFMIIKLNFLVQLGCALGTIWKPMMIWVLWRRFHNF